ncbi:MAG: SDR family oxidoreductase [Proteobacteria bacterium]|nr:SDR family oxidoreductase [Pseudomonadota bacterium]
MTSFSNKVAAITGAGSGMGRALAEALASRDCHLAISDINSAALEETQARIESSASVTVSCHELDVADRQQVEQFAADVVDRHGQVNMIFNNAGVSVTDTVEHIAYEDFEWLMNINFWGLVYGSKSFLPYFKDLEEAHIINTSSIFGVIAVPSQSAYNASKFAVRGFTYAMRQELLESNIGVSCVQPGVVKTNIVQSSRYVATDNAAPTKEEFAAQFEEMAGLTAAQAAEQILRGVLANKAQILVGRDAKTIALLERMAPTGYQKMLAWILPGFANNKS